MPKLDQVKFKNCVYTSLSCSKEVLVFFIAVCPLSLPLLCFLLIVLSVCLNAIKYYKSNSVRVHEAVKW